MRVLMICPELPRDDCPGTMAPAARQIKSLRDLGLTIDVVDMQGISKLKYTAAIPRVRRLSRQVDLIHAHFGYCGWLARLAPAFSRSRPPLVVSFMGSDLLGTPVNAAGDLSLFSRLMIRANKTLARKPHQVIVKSRQMAQVIGPVPSTVIPNGVDIEAFRPMDRGESREKLGLPSDGKLVLFPGNPNNPRKGYPLASAAVEFAARQVGEPINLVPLWRRQPDEVPLYMNACDVMVMTSLLEGSPNVVKEAMACNTPVIGVPVGDVEQLLRDVEGCESCARDAQAVGAAIVRSLNRPRITARQAILDRRLDLESVARRIVTVYEEALGERIELPMGTISSDSSGKQLPRSLFPGDDHEDVYPSMVRSGGRTRH